MVIVSDGLNTQNRWSTDQTTIDTRQRILCDNMKRAPYNVKIFALQVNTSTTKPDPVSAVLQYCASSADNFQMITSSGQTAQAFQNISDAAGETACRELSAARLANTKKARPSGRAF